MKFNPVSLFGCLAAFVLVGGVFCAGRADAFPSPAAAAAAAAEAGPRSDPEVVRSALEYLKMLDKHYAQFARPRSRREDVASALMKLSQLRQHYSDVGRPRFGKRTPQYDSEEYFMPVSSN